MNNAERLAGTRRFGFNHDRLGELCAADRTQRGPARPLGHVERRASGFNILSTYAAARDAMAVECRPIR